MIVNRKIPPISFRVGIRNGKKVTTKNVARIGKHSDLLKITDDPLEYAKQKVREYNDQIKNSKVEYHITVDFDEKLINQGNVLSRSTCSNIGYFYLKEIYSSLRLDHYFRDLCKERRIQFDPDLILKMLVFSRILNPGSKRYTLDHLHEFYGDFDISHQDVLRFMDILSDNYDGYLAHLFDASNSVIKRNTSICYF